MKTLVRIIGLITATILIIIGILSLFIHLYFTPEKLKTIITTQAEKTLHTKVEIGSVEIGLFKGIVVKDLHVKEPNSNKDLTSLKKFVLYYKFWPLLHGQLDISNIELDSPYIFVVRDKNNKLNVSYLLKSSKNKPNKVIKTKAPITNKALPLVLAIKQIVIKNANIFFKDLKDEIPDVHIIGNSKIKLHNLSISKGNLIYSGNFILNAVAYLNKQTFKLNTKGNFDTAKINSIINLYLNEQVVNIETLVKNYMTKPDINIDIHSKKLDINKLIALISAITPKSKQQKQTNRKQINLAKNEKNNKGMNNNVHIKGKINIEQVLYKELILSQLKAKFWVKDNKIIIRPLNCYVANGQLSSSITVQNQKVFTGSLKLNKIDLGILLSQLAVKQAENIKGALDLNLVYNARGSNLKQIENSLSADGNYSISNLSLRKTPILISLSKLLNTKDLSKLTFKKASGNLHIKHGKVFIDGLWRGKELKLKLKGRVGFNKSIYMPVDLYLSKKYTKKIRLSKTITKFLQNKNGLTKLSIVITGSINKPRIKLSSKAVNQAIQKGIENLLYKYIK